MKQDTTKNVYLAIKGDVVVHHTDLSAMASMDGISKPDMTITEEEFERVGGLIRVINGKIFLGKTKEEINIENNKKRVEEIDNELNKIDILSSRSSRAVAYALATGIKPDVKDIEKVTEYEENAVKLRNERATLI